MAQSLANSVFEEDKQFIAPLYGKANIEFVRGEGSYLFDKNGKIDTVPEALDAVQNIGDDTELSVMTDADTDDMMHRILGNGDNGNNNG